MRLPQHRGLDSSRNLVRRIARLVGSAHRGPGRGRAGGGSRSRGGGGDAGGGWRDRGDLGHRRQGSGGRVDVDIGGWVDDEDAGVGAAGAGHAVVVHTRSRVDCDPICHLVNLQARQPPSSELRAQRDTHCGVCRTIILQVSRDSGKSASRMLYCQPLSARVCIYLCKLESHLTLRGGRDTWTQCRTDARFLEGVLDFI